jgi:hypothetical protein
MPLMDPHEALTLAAQRLIEWREGDTPPDDTDALTDALLSLAEAYAPYAGDDPRDAVKRTAQAIACRNCGLRVESLYVPAPMHRAANAMIRRGICPRCFATQGLMLQWDDPKATVRLCLAGTVTKTGHLGGTPGRVRVTVEGEVNDAFGKQLRRIGKEKLPATVEITLPKEG